MVKSIKNWLFVIHTFVFLVISIPQSVYAEIGSEVEQLDKELTQAVAQLVKEQGQNSDIHFFAELAKPESFMISYPFAERGQMLQGLLSYLEKNSIQRPLLEKVYDIIFKQMNDTLGQLSYNFSAADEQEFFGKTGEKLEHSKEDLARVRQAKLMKLRGTLDELLENSILKPIIIRTMIDIFIIKFSDNIKTEHKQDRVFQRLIEMHKQGIKIAGASKSAALAFIATEIDSSSFIAPRKPFPWATVKSILKWTAITGVSAISLYALIKTINSFNHSMREGVDAVNKLAGQLPEIGKQAAGDIKAGLREVGSATAEKMVGTQDNLTTTLLEAIRAFKTSILYLGANGVNVHGSLLKDRPPSEKEAQESLERFQACEQVVAQSEERLRSDSPQSAAAPSI